MNVRTHHGTLPVRPYVIVFITAAVDALAVVIGLYVATIYKVHPYLTAFLVVGVFLIVGWIETKALAQYYETVRQLTTGNPK